MHQYLQHISLWSSSAFHWVASEICCPSLCHHDGCRCTKAFRDQSRYASSQWETSLQCNDVSHWLGAYLDWSLAFLHYIDRDRSRYMPSQWETLSQCNDVSHWLGTYLLIPALDHSGKWTDWLTSSWWLQMSWKAKYQAICNNHAV